jgi:4a-hydroxytetrahydrobiopterin dehydratase
MGAAINRFFAFDDEANSTKFIDSVRAAADRMDHHPDIATSPDPIPDNSPLRYVAISCSTHRPPGLSMKDVRLARKIDELAESFSYMAMNADAKESTLGAIRRDLVRKLRNQRDGNLSLNMDGT